MKQFYLPLVLFFSLLISQFSWSQVKVGDNPTQISPFTVFELESTDKGFLPPRLTTTQRNGIDKQTAPLGLMIYNLDRNEVQYLNEEISIDATGKRLVVRDWESATSGASLTRPDAPEAGELYFDPDTGSLEVWNGSQWLSLSLGATTSSPTLLIDGSMLTIVGGNTVDLSTIIGQSGPRGGSGATGPTGPAGPAGPAGATGGDNQTLTLSGTTLSIQNGNSVNLSVITNTDSQTITASLSGTILQLLPENTTVTETLDLAYFNNTGTDDQNLSFATSTSTTEGELVIESGNPVTLITSGTLSLVNTNSSTLTLVSTATHGQLIQVNEGAKTGYRLLASNHLHHGDIGTNAVDLSVQTAVSTSTGARGNYSFASGRNSIASGHYSYASGRDAQASGDYSFSSGRNSIVSGQYSFAGGLDTSATGSYSVAMGRASVASGTYSIALGNDTQALGFASMSWGGTTSTASGSYSTSWGGGLAGGDWSTAFGRATEALGNSSYARGLNTKASGNYSSAWGLSSTAPGSTSTAWGWTATASGSTSTAGGAFTTAESFGQTSLGIYNTPHTGTPSETGIIPTDRLFVLGNGTGTASRSDALVILKNGDTSINGDLTVSGTVQITNLPTGVATDVLVVADTSGNLRQLPISITGTDSQTLSFITSTSTTTAEIALSGSQSLTLQASGTLAFSTVNTTTLQLIGGGQLIQVTEGVNTGHRIATRDTNNHGNIGSNAVDLSYSTISSTLYGATGFGSFATGRETRATGLQTTALGHRTLASGDYSVAIGYTAQASERYAVALGRGQAQGDDALAVGPGVFAYSLSEVALGAYPSIYTASSKTAWIPTDRLLVLGNGTGTASRSDALVILKSGATTLNGPLTINASSTTVSYTLPIGGGANNQVLTMLDASSGTTTWTTLVTPTLLVDADGDTSISVEHSPDVDQISFTVSGTQHYLMRKNAAGAVRLDVLNSYSSVYIGENAGSNSSTASATNNTAVGTNALSANVSGTNNTALGNFSLRSNATGAENTALGHNTLQTNSRGNANVAVGVYALSNATASGNTAVGSGAGEDISTGENNTLLGGNTGRGITTGSRNTIIGSGITGLSATLTNTVIIADGSGNRRIYVNNLGNTGLNTTAPTAVLDVNGTARLRTLPTGVATDVLVVADTSGNLRQLPITKAGTDTQTLTGTVSGTDLLVKLSNVATETLDLSYFNNTGTDTQTLTGTVSGTDLLVKLSNVATETLDLSYFNNTGTDSQSIAELAYEIGTGSLTVGITNGASQTLSLATLGSTTVSGTLTLRSGTSSYTLPNLKGATDQVLTMLDASSGTTTWTTPEGLTFIVSGTTVLSRVGTATHDFIFGATQFDNIVGATDDARFFFDKSKGAFRAGYASGTTWNDVNIGDRSTALGYNTEASGDRSTALGNGTEALSYAETTLGSYSTNPTPSSKTAWITSDRLFVVGNGSSLGNRSDALVIQKSGATRLNGDLTVSGTVQITNLPTGVATDVLVVADTSGNLRQLPITGAGTDTQTLSIASGTGSTSIINLTGSSSITLESGSNVILTENPSTNTIIISATGSLTTGTDSQTLAFDNGSATTTMTTLTLVGSSQELSLVASGSLSFTNTDSTTLMLTAAGGGSGKFVDGSNPANAVYTAGNVGIATATPTASLHVSGTFIAEGTTRTGSTTLLKNPGAFPANPSAILGIDGGTDARLRLIAGSDDSDSGTRAPNIDLYGNNAGTDGGIIDFIAGNVTAFSSPDGAAMRFYTYASTSSSRNQAMTITSSGTVGIGDATPTEATLVVSGTIAASGSISANASVTADYVFEKFFEGESELNPAYEFPTLEAVEAFVKENHHLPNIPSAAEVKEQGGIILNRASELQLEKIEELYLHTILQQKQLDAKDAEINALKARLAKIEAALGIE